MKKLIYISIDPVATSRRAINQINTALDSGFSVEIITVKNNGASLFKGKKGVKINYIRQNYTKGVLRFAEFNFKLFLLLLHNNFDLLICRGLWVFPGIIPIKILKKFNLIYDAHEYFAGHTHFDNKPIKRGIWLFVERIAMRISDALITVSEPIAEQYVKDYPHIKRIFVIRNLPDRNLFHPYNDVKKQEKEKKKAKDTVKTVVFSGYLLSGRALHQIIKAFSYINDEHIKLLIIGEGILRNELNQLTNDLKLTHRISFKDMVSNNEIVPLLSNYHLGLSLIEADCLNRRFALPNKFFEYIAAGIPLLGSDIITQKVYIDKYQVGMYLNSLNAQDIARAIMQMLADKKNYKRWKQNCVKAAMELNWEKESLKLKKIYELFN